MVSENKITLGGYSFHYILNIAEPKIYEILPSMNQTQFSCP